ncbi:right-handed parallel beta-helix repeat-containing protein [Halorubrum ezzemoulense]|uniref:right-handed parallel beta-helix repeat-containing protein n=1 Tax=Halorubrum ezzemoulense TaxID=337243 RepID=UPI00233127C9|nr:right-handed parallel beta-helix repeat-containing protein [Halorubrum ezzemoulense]MDB2283234.1 right-handed parallel beta-helix repeat-containing protein [Halorubrum ezzemoulense]
MQNGPLRIEDFVAQTDGVNLSDLPPAAQERLNDKLADLTGGSDGSGISQRDTDGILVSKNLDGREGFETIADALAGQNLQNAGDQTGSPPDSDAAILVEPGTYDDGPLQIETTGLTLLSREGPGETTVESRVTVSADDVTVAGLSVSPPDPGDAQGADEAIRVDSSADDVTITDNVVEDFARNTGTEFTGVDGINIFGGDGTDAVENVTVRGNIIRQLQNTGNEETDYPGGAAGISLQGNVRNPTVENNTIEQIGEEVTNFGFGIVVRGTGNNDQTPTEVTIENNDIDSVLSDPDSATVGVGIGIGLKPGGASDVTFAGNDISNTEFLFEDKTATVDLGSFVEDNTVDRGALVEDGDFEGVPGGAPERNVISDSIQFALNFATTGSTVEVVPGTYDDEKTFNGVNGLQIGSQDAGTDPESAPLADISIVGINGRPNIPGWVQILDPGVTFEGFEVTDEVNGYGLAAFEPDVTVRDVTISDVTNGLFVPSAADVLIENCTVENYSFYGAVVSGRGSFGGATPTISNTIFNGASGGGAVGVGVVETEATLQGNEITGNEFEGEDGAGVGMFSGAAATVQENVIANNDDGIFVAGGASASDVAATSNDIVDNRVGVANETATAVNANGNWWGDQGGPSGTNEEPNQGPVTADSWSTQSGPDWNTNGGSTSAGATGFSIASTETTRTAESWGGPMPPAEPDRAE